MYSYKDILYTSRRGYFWKFMVGVCRPVLQILTPISDQKMLFSTPVFRPSVYVIITRLERKPKNSSNAFRIRTFLLRSYSFGITTINSFIHSRSSLVNHTRFQTKIGKVYTQEGVYPFSDPKSPKSLPVGAANTCMAYTREYPSPPGVYRISLAYFGFRSKIPQGPEEFCVNK